MVAGWGASIFSPKNGRTFLVDKISPKIRPAAAGEECANFADFRGESAWRRAVRPGRKSSLTLAPRGSRRVLRGEIFRGGTRKVRARISPREMGVAGEGAEFCRRRGGRTRRGRRASNFRPAIFPGSLGAPIFARGGEARVAGSASDPEIAGLLRARRYSDHVVEIFGSLRARRYGDHVGVRVGDSSGSNEPSLAAAGAAAPSPRRRVVRRRIGRTVRGSAVAKARRGPVGVVTVARTRRARGPPPGRKRQRKKAAALPQPPEIASIWSG